MPESTTKKTRQAKPRKVAIYLPSLNSAKKLLALVKNAPGENEGIVTALKEGIKRVEGRRTGSK